MAKHEVIIHENTGATKESAPYLGSYIAKETVKEDSFASSACAKAEISYSDLQNVKGVFEGVEVEAGEYTIAVYTRSGMGEEYGVKSATRKVTVK